MSNEKQQEQENPSHFSDIHSHRYLVSSNPLILPKENSSSASVSNKPNRVKRSPSSKTSTSKTHVVFNPVVESHSVSRDLLKQHEESKELWFNPMAASKIASCPALDNLAAGNGNLKNRFIDDEKSNTSSNKSKTPQLQVSFSPKIQKTPQLQVSFSPKIQSTATMSTICFVFNSLKYTFGC
ncbi:hypothetical protein GOBAR_DD04156 [Gossypium barbadense]|nr:hypothetical protein GOBAR_DD04156 [Gossypium barbadense]